MKLNFIKTILTLLIFSIVSSLYGFRDTRFVDKSELQYEDKLFAGFLFNYTFANESVSAIELSTSSQMMGFSPLVFYHFKPRLAVEADFGWRALMGRSYTYKGKNITIEQSQDFFPLQINMFYMLDFSGLSDSFDDMLGIGGGLSFLFAGNHVIRGKVEEKSSYTDLYFNIGAIIKKQYKETGFYPFIMILFGLNLTPGQTENVSISDNFSYQLKFNFGSLYKFN